MRKQVLLPVIITIFLLSFASLAYCSTQTFTVPALRDYTAILTLTQNDRVSGSIVVQGGVSNAINFYVTDPSGNNVVSFIAVVQTSFSFRAQTSGNYTVHFDNRDGLLAKNVTFNYSDKGSILGFAQDTFILIALAVIIIVAVVIVVVLVLSRRPKEAAITP